MRGQCASIRRLRRLTSSRCAAGQAALREAGISVLGGDRAAPRMGLGPAPSARIEYGANTLTLELVAGLDEAVDHIHANGSGHTEAIITGALRAGRPMSRPVDGCSCASFKQLGVPTAVRAGL